MLWDNSDQGNQGNAEHTITKRILDNQKPGRLDSKWEKRIRDQACEIVEFETKIAKITKSASQRRQDTKTYRNTTLTALNRHADFLNWTEYFDNAFMYHLDKPLDKNKQDVTYADEYIGK